MQASLVVADRLGKTLDELGDMSAAELALWIAWIGKAGPRL